MFWGYSRSCLRQKFSTSCCHPSFFFFFVGLSCINIFIIIIIIISFTQGIYTYIPETNNVPREYSVVAFLLLLFTVLISLVSVLSLLYFYISTFRSMCAVPSMAVFWSSLTLCFLGILLTYFLNDFERVPVAPVITGITFVFFIVRSLYFRIFSASFLITFLSPEIAKSINIHVPFSLSRIIISGLFLGIVLSVCICWFHNVVTLPPSLVSTDFYIIIQISPVTGLDRPRGFQEVKVPRFRDNGTGWW